MSRKEWRGNMALGVSHGNCDEKQLGKVIPAESKKGRDKK
jgi:hypothetical protein